MNTTQKFSPEQIRAAETLLLRRNARKSLADWSRVCGYEPAKHHLLLIDRLEAVVRGDIRKLAIFMPPGSAKSTYSSVLFPPWFLAQQPSSSILTCSHSADLATSFGRRSRNLIDDHEKVLGYGLREDSKAADEWATNNGGVFFCAGVGGRIAGRRADLALIDDPVGSKDDAYSKPVRDSHWTWYNFDFKTRLKPNARIVLVQTRWHEEDLAGKLLATEGDEWVIINLPMLAKENDPLGRKVGELLWSDYFTPRMLMEAQKNNTVFSALYQQDPTAEDGDYFKRAWIDGNAYDRHQLPSIKELTIYVSSDHAVSLKEDADSSCMIPCGVDSEGIVWILPDVEWSKFDTLQAVNIMIGKMRLRMPRCWWAEGEKISKSIGPFLRRQMKEEGVFCYIEELHPAKDKMTRAQSIRGRLQAGMVRFPRYAPWYADAVNQMMKFPAGTHDDFVDALAYIGLGLDKMLSGTKTKAPAKVTFDPPPITLKWVKDSHRGKSRFAELVLRDN